MGTGAAISGDYSGKPAENPILEKIKENKIVHKVDNKKYNELMNYVRGIRGLEEKGKMTSPYFACDKGEIFFVKTSNSEEGRIIYSNNLRLSESDKLNEMLMEELLKRLKN